MFLQANLLTHMVASKVLNAHLKTIRGIVVKGFGRMDEKFVEIDQQFKKVDERFDTLERKIDETRLELKSDIEHVSLDLEDLAESSAKEFKEVRSEIASAALFPHR